MPPRKKREKIPFPGSKGEKSTNFYSKKKWRSLMQYSSLEIPGHSLGARGALVVGTALLKNHYVVRLDLSNTELGDEGAITLTEILKANSSIQTLYLANNGITDVGGIALASSFIPNVSASGQPGLWNRTLFNLILTGNECSDDTLLAFSNAAACHLDLNCVDLSWNHVGPSGTKCLMRCFQRNPLCNFILAANNIGDDGTIYLCEALQRYGGKSQTTLNLYRNDISHRGAAAIGRLLTNNEVVLDVNLCGNTLGVRGLKELAQCLSTSTCALRNLNLCDNMFGDEGAKDLASIIAADLPELIRMDISDNRFTDKGATLLMQALLKNTKLQLVNCENNTFGKKAVEAVEALIRETTSLKSLNLVHCIESADARRALTIVVGEVEGVHVEMGNRMTDEIYPPTKMAEYLQIIADQEAAKALEAKKTKKRKRRKSVAR